eukprot:CAMPEP_0175532814 /NCGR_PEP_ID=MMETSP0096-20121207/22860_1 /TAXON_ID=311494 /ORGANISM="Alexandrium monilatum, Strain CCMP3105" /LENGTH=254 /DNA_ID=CAMNT_0016835557 /DNA_START=76 /DNA_END=839 /DNA_ORIENTATION=-
MNTWHGRPAAQPPPVGGGLSDELLRPREPLLHLSHVPHVARRGRLLKLLAVLLCRPAVRPRRPADADGAGWHARPGLTALRPWHEDQRPPCGVAVGLRGPVLDLVLARGRRGLLLGRGLTLPSGDLEALRPLPPSREAEQPRLSCRWGDLWPGDLKCRCGERCCGERGAGERCLLAGDLDCRCGERGAGERSLRSLLPRDGERCAERESSLLRATLRETDRERRLLWREREREDTRPMAQPKWPRGGWAGEGRP